MKHYFTYLLFLRKTRISLLIGVLLLLHASAALAQLGVYDFTGPGACPNQNPAVISQPANASFSDFTNVNATCDPLTDVFQYKDWNSGSSIDLTQYNEFTVTPNAGYTLTLTSLSFTQEVNDPGTTTWTLRSSMDNFATDIATGTATTASQTQTIALPPVNFTNIGTITFRLYLLNAHSNGTRWIIDDVTLNGVVSPAVIVVTAPADPANPTSNSPQCPNPGVTMNFNGSAPAGETWYWQTSATGTSTASATATYTVTASGTYYVRSQDNTTLAWSSGAGSITISVLPDVAAPLFALGLSSTRCQGAATVSYTAAATNATAIAYGLDVASISGGNSIDPATGDVTYVSGWSGTSMITANAVGCNGPISATHTVTITPAVNTPVFTLGATSTRCQGAETVTYTANVAGTTYSLDAASIADGNSINTATGDVNFVSGWTGISIITANATGCNGIQTATHTVTTTASVSTAVFMLGATSTRCQGAGTVTYTATATNTTGISYSLDATSAAAGNSINNLNGAVTYTAGWSGTSTVTATAAGCGGPASASHTVTITPTAGIPVFTLGATSTRCQGAGNIIYTANATNTTGITYSLDAASFAAGNSINTATGTVIYASNWTGTTIITASAAGCNGPITSTHTVSITPTVGTTVFALGVTSTRCQGTATVTYTATATNTTGITYSLDAASITGGNSINTGTGAVSYVASWSGTSVITATATGCNGPTTSTHTVTTKATVTVPVFALGATSTRCQGAGTITYSAAATNSTGITYSLDAASTTAGNSINAATGVVNYLSGWSGTSTITASAAGCNGPTTSTHTVTITPTAGIPVFTLGSTSTRCQGAGTVTYAATATNTTGITYSLDAATIAGGNSITAATGAVSYVSGWSGTSTITASAAGCNGPITGTHIVTVTPTVGIPVFVSGPASIRTQGAGTVVYTGSATNTTGIAYTLDAASIAGGNSINAATGAVTYAAGWYGASTINATAAGCNGPSTATHSVTSNAAIVNIPLYLSDPGQGLDRVDPVATGITTTVQTALLSSAGTTNTTFTQNPVLGSDLVIKAQPITVSVYLSISSGTMPANPAMTALLKYGGSNIISLTNPTYNSATKILTWTGTTAADITVPAGQAIALQITTAQAGVTFKVEYHSQAKPSKIMLPVATYIDISSFDIYNAAYPAGSIRNSSTNSSVVYARAVVTNPFGTTDNNGVSIKITPPGTMVSATSVATAGITTTYQYAWTTPASTGNYTLTAIAKEGFENTITRTGITNFSICTICPPVAVIDSATGNGGAPIIVDVLANDYDPNNNIKVSALSIFTQPNNGTGYLSNNKIVYLPNGSYAGKDTLVYQVCDSTGLCSTGKVFFTINPLLVDPCSEATKSHVYYLPFSENEARIALDSSTNTALASNNIRTVISMKMPYPGMVIVWDHWEDGYEANALNPTQSTTQVWGDGNPYNGIAPGYADDIIPAGGSIVLDNTMPTNPRVPGNIFYDGKDKITASGQITVTQVCGEPSTMAVQCMKTNVSATADYGTSFTIPVGQNFPSQDFRYTSLFIRAAQNNTVINIDKDNNGTFETTATINEGQVYQVNGGVLSGATVTASALIGVELHFGGNDSYSSRDVPIFPASWYYNTYFSPVPTTGSSTAIKDTNVVMLYNSLNRPLTINWSSGIPSSGTVVLPAKTVIRFPLALSQSAAYKFVNPTGESFTAIQICDSYTPGGGGNTGLEYDWSFNLIALNRLTDFATVAWAPGSLDGTRNDNPIWVTPTNNTTIYVKYNGNISGASGLLSPCGMRYDVSYPLNALNHKRLLDASDNDQSGLAVFTCDGTKLAAVYGEDASTAVQANPSWDVGSTIQPFCKAKLIFANDDYSRTMVSQPVTIPILLNDYGFLAVIDPTSVTTTALLQPKHGIVSINANGTILYTPNSGYVGKDTFEYSVCSTPTPVVCDNATVYVDISSCPTPLNENILSGQVFLDKNKDSLNNDGGAGIAGAKVYLYVDGNCTGTIDANELKDSVTVDASGTYQFTNYPEKYVADDFDGPGNTNSCAGGSDGNAAWASNWVDAGDPSTGFCNNGQTAANTDAEIVKDAAFTYALRLKDNNVSATRTVNLSGASYAFLSFSYRRKSATLTSGHNVIVQASSNGSTFGTVYTISGDGTTDAGYVTIYNQDITAYAAATTYIRFLTNNNVTDADTVYIDNVKVQFLRYPQCYITKLAPSSVPANYHMTTATQNNVTATNSTTCLTPFDFGMAKNTVSISGTLFNDANGLVDNLVNGTGIGLVSSQQMNAYLADTSGKVVSSTTVNSSNGTYSFPTVDVQSTYNVALSTANVNLGIAAPSNVSLSAGWTTTGDTYGVNNLVGTGIKAGNPTASVNVITGTSNVTAVNFGIERLPNSDDKSVTYALNTPGLLYDIPLLTGSDPEDGSLGVGNTYKITSLPANAVLFYNGIAITLNQVIPSFNPAWLKIDPTDGLMVATFTYASMDAAGLFDPTPATVTVNWVSMLPVILFDFSGKLNGTKVDLFWKTSMESNSDHYEVEHGTDGQEFKAFANVRAKGNSSVETDYAAVDPLPAKGLNYYRLKMVDRDASFAFSKIITIKVNSDASLETRVMPNPFTGKLDIYLTLPHNCNVAFNFVDVSGKIVYSKKVKGYKGFNWFIVNDLERLPTAPYILNLVTDENTFTQKLIKQ